MNRVSGERLHWRPTRAPAGVVALVSLGMLTACDSEASAAGDAIGISGSSTVAPVTERIAAEGGYDVEVAREGTISGFERFCAGETQINNASEAIPGEGQPVDFMALCEENGVEYLEVPIGLDALTVVRHASNDFASDLTSEELQQIWEPGSEVETWADIRSEWPPEQIRLVGRPAGSGTFDVFTHQVVGETGEIREDYEATDDLEELAAWIAEDENAMGFMGIGNYYTTGDDEVREELSTVSVDGVAPSMENAQSGEYALLSRPLFIYVSVEAVEQHEELEDFVVHYIESAYDTLPRTFFYRLPEDLYGTVLERFEAGETGSLYEGDPFAEESITALLR